MLPSGSRHQRKGSRAYGYGYGGSPTSPLAIALRLAERAQTAIRRQPRRAGAAILAALLLLLWLASSWSGGGSGGGGGVGVGTRTGFALSPALSESLASVRAQLASDLALFEPRRSVAFAIPVGGRTERSAQLRRIIHTLVEGGAPIENIFVFEDVQSRADRRPSPHIAAAIQQINEESRAKAQASGLPASSAGQVTLVGTHVVRERAEDASNFGIHLARHYRQMLDHMLVGDTAAQVEAHRMAVEAHARAAQIGIASALGSPPTLGSDTFDFVAIIEDDLELAPDTAKYFQQMSRLMRADPSVYCAAAHQDNAFMATSAEESGVARLDPLNFAFRRGNHFMAPGWMTSRRVYRERVRQRWLDAQGQYVHKEQLHLLNGHWDRFFDSVIGEMDCIFPEVPRIIHEGADGFTVSKKGQMELYTNLRLSSLPVAVDYCDLSRLSLAGFVATTQEFISQATLLSALEESTQFRGARLVYHVQARDDRDNEWNAVLNDYFGLIGVGGYGGFVGYVKVRGIFHGAVFVRWMSNLILLVGSYSPYAPLLGAKAAPAEVALRAEGCFDAAVLTQPVKHYTRATVGAEACMRSCLHLGYAYSGVVNGAQCGCAAALPDHNGDAAASASKGDATMEPLLPLQVAPGRCSASCLGAAAHSALRASLAQGVSALLGVKHPCGGRGVASIYSVDRAATDAAAAALVAAATAAGGVAPTLPRLPTAEESLSAPSDALFVAGLPEQSCTEACAARGAGYSCAESLFPLLHRSCAHLSRLLGCSRCTEEADIERGFATPGRVSAQSDVCTFAKGKYIMCGRKPANGYLRACVCKRDGPAATKAAINAPRSTTDL